MKLVFVFTLVPLAASANLETPVETPLVMPIQARVTTKTATIHLDARSNSPVTGQVEQGTRLKVFRCIPDCMSPGAWALLYEKGAVRFSSLEPEGFVVKSEAPNEIQYDFATVVKQTEAYQRPDSRSRVIARLPDHRGVALVPNEELRQSGWAQRAHGGFVHRSALRVARPSPLVGERNPTLPLAFTVRKTSLRFPPEAEASPLLLPKYSRLPVQEDGGKRIRVTDGFLIREAVRIAKRREVPAGIPPQAKWIHIDLTEQVVVAYEGDRPVYATLVSTGSRWRPTRAGLHRVWSKTLHDRMHGTDYELEEVPFSQFFHRGQALHGSFWHDRFGRAISHGCVNLSIADARWLFDWAPPKLPTGWRSVSPAPREEALWVLIEGSLPKLRPSQLEHPLQAAR